jgi:hypothetical protein
MATQMLLMLPYTPTWISFTPTLLASGKNTNICKTHETHQKSLTDSCKGTPAAPVHPSVL